MGNYKAFIRILATDLRALGPNVAEDEIADWTPARIRSAALWVRLMIEYVAGIGSKLGTKEPPAFKAFMKARAKLRSCKSCGCTEDNACPGEFEEGCEWVEKDLRSACVEPGTLIV